MKIYVRNDTGWFFVFINISKTVNFVLHEDLGDMKEIWVRKVKAGHQWMENYGQGGLGRF